MQKVLNTENAAEAMEKKGLTQTAVAENLAVSKEAVSQWLNAKSFPRPNKLLQLGKLLGLTFEQLVIKQELNAPKVAFRKKASAKTKNHHVEKAQEMGRFLRHLVPYLPFDTFEMPPVLKSPSCDYDYLHKVAAKVREDINVGPTDRIDFKHLIRRFSELQAVVIPVLWGTKQRHENAIHIYLPDSQSTWVYLNLDTNIHDFKFWMAHELGHCMSPGLDGDEAEDFADAFAGCLLYPSELAERAYEEVVSIASTSARINKLKELAEKQVISPNSVLQQVNKYAVKMGYPEIKMGNSFFAAITKFNQQYLNVSDALLKPTGLDEQGKPKAKAYLELSNEGFETPIFELLKAYIKEHNKGPGFVQTVLDMPLLDARSIHTELT